MPMTTEHGRSHRGGENERRLCRSNLDRVRAEVAEACRRAGRDPAGVRIVGVTKYVPLGFAAMLVEAGCFDLGESRPQSLWERAEALPAARWHLIGRLQRNKVRRTLPLVSLVHSLDSRRLLDAIATEAGAAGSICDALVEVNLDGDPARGGLAAEEVPGLLDVAARSPAVRIRGLMGMASAPGPGTPADGPRRQFALLRRLRDNLAADHPGCIELSMGMSGDFVDAVLEGSTMIRIGSALWEGMAAADASATPGG